DDVGLLTVDYRPRQVALDDVRARDKDGLVVLHLDEQVETSDMSPRWYEAPVEGAELRGARDVVRQTVPVQERPTEGERPCEAGVDGHDGSRGVLIVPLYEEGHTPQSMSAV
ncbi:hypothetical protein Vretifemale_20757, partial [Volvox reticuliferus]